MASLGMGFGAAAAAAAGSGRAIATRASKSSAGSTEEKGLLDFILGSLQKEDQLLETDPVLNKTEAKTTGNGRPAARKSTTTSSSSSVSVPDSKKSGGIGGVFGGLFAKK